MVTQKYTQEEEAEIHRKYEESRQYFAKIKAEDFKIINDNFEYAESSYGEGSVVCKHCQKAYKWNEWGRKRSRALTMAGKHIAKVHKVGKYDWCSPITLKTNFIKWVDEKENTLEIEQIKNAPEYSIGDKVEVMEHSEEDIRKAEIIEIIDENHKQSYCIDKNHKIMFLIREDSQFNSEYIVSVTMIRKIKETN